MAGVALLAAALAIQAILLETTAWAVVLAGAGVLLSAWSGYALRVELGALFRRRRGEIVLFTTGVVGALIALGYFTAHYPMRFDLTEAGLYSLPEQTATMLDRLEQPVKITYFHDRMMRETVELYQLMADRTDMVTVEFYDPTLNPAQARMLGVQFAGTAIMVSEDRELQVHGNSETDIANGILRVSQGAKQRICFLDGHGEADPFSTESHDHLESTGGHSHGLGVQYVLHETHGLAKARNSLETTNYTVAKLSLAVGGDPLADCAVLVVAGPKAALLPGEVVAVEAYLLAGGNGYFMLDPFLETGLEPVLRQYGVNLDDTMVIDEASHFWSDISAPAVTSYNNHAVTRELPLTFFPGARSLSPTARVPGTNVSPLINSSTNSYAETSADRAEFDEGSDMAGPNTLMVIAIRRPVTPDSAAAIALGPREQTDAAEPPAAVNEATAESRIAVVGDSDFATNSFFHFLGNGNLFLNTVNYLAAQENLIGIEPRTYDLPRLSLTNRQMKGTFFLAVFLIPALLAVIGTGVWWRRR
ncbi:MAG: GldG family protein [Alphaproteobacteria bacterium]|nr:GldG family protein [Alphaproteobacteria bacterium]